MNGLVDYQTDARDIGGPLDAQVAEALHFVRRNMLVRAAKVTGRTQRPQFSERAVFEALVNAVAHRDYSVAGSRVRLHLFGDRLELYVPGALANTLTPDSLHLRQASRNELIVSLLARCPAPSGVGRMNLMDRRGDGLPIIRCESRTLSSRLPEYTPIDDELRLVIWAAEPAPDPTAAGRGGAGRMNVFTIGFTRKSADRFFGLLRSSGARRVVDVRLNNVSQLAGFAKKNDLAYFLAELCGMEYVHLPELAPTKDILDDFKKRRGDWDTYERRFLDLMRERRIERTVPREVIEDGCLLCSEDTPHHCHRRLVAEYLSDHWGRVEIRHLG